VEHDVVARLTGEFLPADKKVLAQQGFSNAGCPAPRFDRAAAAGPYRIPPFPENAACASCPSLHQMDLT